MHKNTIFWVNVANSSKKIQQNHTWCSWIHMFSGWFRLFNTTFQHWCSVVKYPVQLLGWVWCFPSSLELNLFTYQKALCLSIIDILSSCLSKFLCCFHNRYRQKVGRHSKITWSKNRPPFFLPSKPSIYFLKAYILFHSGPIFPHMPQIIIFWLNVQINPPWSENTSQWCNGRTLHKSI